MAILKNQTKWKDLYYYRKSLVLYQMTVAFCRRFLPKYGDRTVNQMVQAARNGKQNIVEAGRWRDIDGNGIETPECRAFEHQGIERGLSRLHHRTFACTLELKTPSVQ